MKGKESVCVFQKTPFEHYFKNFDFITGGCFWCFTRSWCFLWHVFFTIVLNTNPNQASSFPKIDTRILPNLGGTVKQVEFVIRDKYKDVFLSLEKVVYFIKMESVNLCIRQMRFDKYPSLLLDSTLLRFQRYNVFLVIVTIYTIKKIS